MLVFINYWNEECTVKHWKCVTWLSLQILSEKFLILRRNGRDMVKNVYWSSCKVLVTNEAEQCRTLVRQAQLFYCLLHRQHVSTYIQVIFRPSFTDKSIKCLTYHCSTSSVLSKRNARYSIKYSLFLSDFNEICIFSAGFFGKYRARKFHEKPSSGSRAFACGQTDRHKMKLIE